MKLNVRRVPLTVFSLLFVLNVARADVGGKITGIVKDQSNAAIAGAAVVALNTATGVKQTTKTDDQGSYSFSVLPVLQYEIDVAADGSRQTGHKGLTMDINTALTVESNRRKWPRWPKDVCSEDSRTAAGAGDLNSYLLNAS